jgi:hypothetical protein
VIDEEQQPDATDLNEAQVLQAPHLALLHLGNNTKSGAFLCKSQATNAPLSTRISSSTGVPLTLSYVACSQQCIRMAGQKQTDGRTDRQAPAAHQDVVEVQRAPPRVAQAEGAISAQSRLLSRHLASVPLQAQVNVHLPGPQTAALNVN